MKKILEWWEELDFEGKFMKAHEMYGDCNVHDLTDFQIEELYNFYENI